VIVKLIFSDVYIFPNVPLKLNLKAVYLA